MEGTSENKEGDTKEGETTYYYKNGRKKSVTNYVKGRVNGKDLEWYDNGNKKLEGEYIEDKKKKRTAQHKINQFWDITGIQKVTDGNGETYTYTEVEIAPNPKKGIMDFYKFIAKNYRTPEKQGLKGKVYITFVVDKEGKIVEPRALRDIGFGTGEEAIRVVTAYDGFAPGEQRGQKVRCTYSLPISIQSTR